jgi:hypothetical protein
MTTSITTPPLSVAELLDQDFTFHYRHCSFHKLVKNEHTSTLLRTNLPICVSSVGQYLGSLGTMSSTIRAGISKTCQRLLYPSSECRVISAGAKIDRVLSRKWRVSLYPMGLQSVNPQQRRIRSVPNQHWKMVISSGSPRTRSVPPRVFAKDSANASQFLEYPLLRGG